MRKIKRFSDRLRRRSHGECRLRDGPFDSGSPANLPLRLHGHHHRPQSRHGPRVGQGRRHGQRKDP